MTFSIVATDGSAWGVAVASKFLAVGSAVPAARYGSGALATQAWANLAYRADGLALLAEGRSATDTVAALLAADDGRAHRQLGVVDAAGRGATATGSDCNAWAGGEAGEGFAIQGNILTGPEVVAAMLATWTDSGPQTPLAHRLLAVLLAGDRAGGDSRGRQSAAVLVANRGGGYLGSTDIAVDLRVDDHPYPVPELVRLLHLHDILFTPADPASALPLTAERASEVAALLTALGYPPAGMGEDPTGLDAALAAWAAIENVEERLFQGAIDPLVLDQLRAAVG